MSNVQSAVTHERTLAMLRTALGPVITEALEDPKVVEVMLKRRAFQFAKAQSQSSRWTIM